MSYKETPFGFEWGGASITRVFSDRKFGYCFEVVTRRERLQFRVTPSGFIRINKDKKKDNVFRA